MPRPPKLLVVLTVAGVVLAAGGGSAAAGSATRPAAVFRPTTATTAPDVTEPPSAATTSEPATTEAPSQPTEAPTTGASPTEPDTEAPSEDDSSTWWPWLLLGLVAVAAVVGVGLIAGSRRKKTPWAANAGAALAQSDEITTHLVGLEPGGLAAVASADAARLAALAATVQQLASSAPDNASMQAMMAVRGPLQSLHAAVDAVNLTPGPPSDLQVSQVRAAATGLHQATALARANILAPLQAGR